MTAEVRQAIAARLVARRGKSGPRRAGCRLTAGRREATESAAESRPPMAVMVWQLPLQAAQARLKGCEAEREQGFGRRENVVR